MGYIIATGMPLHHVQQVDHTGNYDMVVLMIGRNDLNNGSYVHQLANRIEYQEDHINRMGVRAVVTTSLRPRTI